MKINIQFILNGTAHYLWTDAISLHELGRLKINRATSIEFNNAAQKWEVRDRKGRVRFIAKSRSTCLEWERENLHPGRGSRFLPQNRGMNNLLKSTAAQLTRSSVGSKIKSAW